MSHDSWGLIPFCKFNKGFIISKCSFISQNWFSIFASSIKLKNVRTVIQTPDNSKI